MKRIITFEIDDDNYDVHEDLCRYIHERDIEAGERLEEHVMNIEIVGG